MSAWWTVGLSVVVCICSVNSRFELEGPVRAARCRATCVYKMPSPVNADADCEQSLFCSQCWKTCDSLKMVASLSPLCTSEECGPGCQEACRFHSLSPSQVSPVPLEEVLSVNNTRVSWPPLQDPVVYVVMVGGSQLRQTLEPSVSLPSTVDQTTVRVLVVDWRGLVKVLAPVAESPVDQALHILRSLGMEDVHPTQIVSENYVTNVNHSPKKIRVDSSWRVSLLSLLHQPSLVLAQIGWNSYHKQLLKRNQLLKANQLTVSYLVSWAAEDDVVRGNLLTNTSSATLSLWPNNLYTIQVALFCLQAPTIQSEPMTLDTHHLLEPSDSSSQPTTSRLPVLEVHADLSVDDNVLPAERRHEERVRGGEDARGARGEVAAGVSAAVFVFLGVVLTATWRWRHRLYLPHNKLLEEEIDAPNLYRVFPPVIRLLGDTDASSMDMFSSSDNLVQRQ